jgi:mannose-1-phosphate guanylyltransferase/phosphomannomutase
MLPLIDRPVLAYILDLLQRHHFSEVMIATHYMPERIQSYFGDGRHRGMTLQYSVEKMPLGTAGSVKNAQPYLDDAPFLVISGDIVTDINLSQVVQFHHEKDALATLALTHMADPTQYGVVVTDEFGRVQHYLEKPSAQQCISNWVNTGIYVLDPTLLDEIKPNAACDFSYDVFPRMLNRNDAFFGYRAEGYWRDMGTIQSYQQCLADVRAGEVELLRETTPGRTAMNESAGPARALFAELLDLPREPESRIRETLRGKVPIPLLAQ